MKRILIVLCALCLLLSACGKAPVEPSATESPAEPTPSPAARQTRLSQEERLQHELEDTLDFGRDELRNTLWSRGLDLDERVYERTLERMNERERCSALYKHAEQSRSILDLSRANKAFSELSEHDRDNITLRVNRNEAYRACGIEPERRESRDIGFERGRGDGMGDDRGWDIADTFRGR